MAEKIKPCSLAKRHSWEFVRNRITKYINGRTVHLSQRGVYRCECGAKKLGDPQLDAPMREFQGENGQGGANDGP